MGKKGILSKHEVRGFTTKRPSLKGVSKGCSPQRRKVNPPPKKLSEMQQKMKIESEFQTTKVLNSGRVI